MVFPRVENIGDITRIPAVYLIRLWTVRWVEESKEWDYHRSYTVECGTKCYKYSHQQQMKLPLFHLVLYNNYSDTKGINVAY